MVPLSRGLPRQCEHWLAMTLMFYRSILYFDRFSQFGKSSRFAAGDKYLASSDLIQHKILSSGIQLRENIIQKQNRFFPSIPLLYFPLGKL